MVRLRNFISASLAVIIFTNCNTNTNSSYVIPILSPSVKKQSENLLTGHWKYISSIWYSSELLLQENGTFKFQDQGCYGQRFSLGEWTNNNGVIELTSFDSFKPKEETKVNKSNKITDQTKPKRKLKKGKVEYSFVGFKDYFPSAALPGPNDTVRIYLYKVQLQLINDTLYCVGTDKLPEEAKFYRNKNNR